MQLTLSNYCAHSAQESDYDTAVDLVHFHEQRVCYELELPSGVRLEVEQASITTTRSYLEPDFDALEAGGELLYLQHPSDEPSTESVYPRVELSALMKERALSQEDWKQASEQAGDADFETVMFLQAEELTPEAGYPPLSGSELFAAVDGLSLRKGQRFDAARLGPAFLQWATRVDAQAWALNAHNSRARLDSRCALALHRLKAHLDAIET